MIKKLAIILLGSTFLFSSCTETPFVPNVDNSLMVGTWNIDQVDNDAAFASGTEMMTSLLDDRFIEGNKFVFEKGANFELIWEESSVSNGKYSISEDNKSLHLQIEGTVYGYDLVEKSATSYAVNSTTAGESINMIISKQ